jgi:uncharacterized OB-fold protein
MTARPLPLGQPEPLQAAPVELVSLAPDSYTAPFWSACAEHRLIAQRCGACGRVRQPPGPFCPSCRSSAFDWTALSGRARLYSYTIVRHALVPMLGPYLPMAIAVVEPVEAPEARLVANLVDLDVADVAIGMELEVVWEDVEPGVAVYRFRPRRGANS